MSIPIIWTRRTNSNLQCVLQCLCNNKNYSTGTGAGAPEVPKSRRRIFSGIQPTGRIHLGNYFGAIRQWVAYQEDPSIQKGNTIYSIVDLHAITLPQKPEVLESSILESTATLLACGIDPEHSILFLQSHVGLHSQLAWILGTLTTLPRLSQLPQFKEKSKSLRDIPLGLFTYPVLQAADILLYNATEIPIGEDNVQHIQLAQHLARGFNRVFNCSTFTVPKPVIQDGMYSRLRSLRKPEFKMSKSESDPRSRICLLDSPDEILEKIKKSVTDFTSEVTYDPEGRPGVSNLIQIHSLCTGQSIEDIVSSCANTKIDTGKYKLVVADALIEYLTPIRVRLMDYLKEPDELVRTLEKGSIRAREIAGPIWETVCQNVGIAPKLSSSSILSKRQINT